MNNQKKVLKNFFFNSDFLKKNSFSVYGLGETGKSATNLFKKKKKLNLLHGTISYPKKKIKNFLIKA